MTATSSTLDRSGAAPEAGARPPEETSPGRRRGVLTRRPARPADRRRRRRDTRRRPTGLRAGGPHPVVPAHTLLPPPTGLPHHALLPPPTGLPHAAASLLGRPLPAPTTVVPGEASHRSPRLAPPPPVPWVPTEAEPSVPPAVGAAVAVAYAMWGVLVVVAGFLDTPPCPGF